MKNFRVASCYLSMVITSSMLAAQPNGVLLTWGEHCFTGTKERLPITGMAIVIKIAGVELTNAVSTAAGLSHALALRADGTVVGWGSNGAGEALGYPTKAGVQTNGVVMVGGRMLDNIVSIAAGASHSLAANKGGKAFGWGLDRGGCTQVPSGLTGLAAVSAGWSMSLALGRTGSIVGWGATSIPVGLTNIVGISEGGDFHEHGLAVTKAGLVEHWGAETIYGDATPPSDLRDVVSVAAGLNYSLALKNDGTVFGWGFNRTGAATGAPNTESPYVSKGPVSIKGSPITNIVAIAACNEVSMGLTKTGEVVVWGNNEWHQAEVPTDATNICAIAAGEGFCLAIRRN